MLFLQEWASLLENHFYKACDKLYHSGAFLDLCIFLGHVHFYNERYPSSHIFSANKSPK